MAEPEVIEPLPAVVLGGGIAGLAAARLLRRHYERVVVLERDQRPGVKVPEEAFTRWERAGVPQFRHSHAFLARARLVLLARMPDVLDRLRAVGTRELTLADTAPPGFVTPARVDDEEVVLLACRRSTFEWALRESVRERPGIELREGAPVAGLEGVAIDGQRPIVTGVRLVDGSVIPAALVVDATGRRSRAPDWLADLGAPLPTERSVETGIFYYTRFYPRRGGRVPRAPTGHSAGDLKWVKVAVFPGDADTFSITVGTPADDAVLKRIFETEHFEDFVRAFPTVRPWRARGASEPIAGDDSPVLVMGQLRNRLRRFVDGDGPLATGFFAIGDAAYHSNPVYGRGVACALVQAALLDEALERHPTDLRAAAHHLDRRSEAELRPFWDAAASADRRQMGGGRRFELTNPLAWLAGMADLAFGWFVDQGMVPAMRVDPVVFRGLMRVFNMLDPPDSLFRDPEVVARTLPVLARVLRGDAPKEIFPVIPRERVLARLGWRESRPAS